MQHSRLHAHLFTVPSCLLLSRFPLKHSRNLHVTLQLQSIGQWWPFHMRSREMGKSCQCASSPVTLQWDECKGRAITHMLKERGTTQPCRSLGTMNAHIHGTVAAQSVCEVKLSMFK